MSLYKINLENSETSEIKINLNSNEIILNNITLSLADILISIYTSGNIGNNKKVARFWIDASFCVYEITINGKYKISFLNNKEGKQLLKELLDILKNIDGKKKNNEKARMIQKNIEQHHYKLIELHHVVKTDEYILGIHCNNNDYPILELPLESISGMLFPKTIKFIWDSRFIAKDTTIDFEQSSTVKTLIKRKVSKISWNFVLLFILISFFILIFLLETSGR